MENLSQVGDIYEGDDLEALLNVDNYYQWIFDELSEYLGNSIVEVGAGIGNFSEFLLKKENSKLHLLEPSGNLYRRLEERFNDNRRIAHVNDYFENVYMKLRDQNVDSIVYVNVLEHVEKDVEELKMMYEALQPGGVVCIFVPALQFLYSNFDKKIGHYRRYRKSELIEKAQGVGFEIEKCKYFDLMGIIPWLINFRLLKSEQINEKMLGIYDKYVVPVMRKLEFRRNTVIGKNVLLVARKK